MRDFIYYFDGRIMERNTERDIQSGNCSSKLSKPACEVNSKITSDMPCFGI